MLLTLVLYVVEKAVSQVQEANIQGDHAVAFIFFQPNKLFLVLQMTLKRQFTDTNKFAASSGKTPLVFIIFFLQGRFFSEKVMQKLEANKLSKLKLLFHTQSIYFL